MIRRSQIAMLVLPFAVLGCAATGASPSAAPVSSSAAGVGSPSATTAAAPTPPASPTAAVSATAAAASATAAAASATPAAGASNEVVPQTAPAGSVVLVYEDTAQLEIVSPAGQRVIVDVWNADLLSRPATAEDVLLTTHSHNDHYQSDFVEAFPGKKLTFESGQLTAKDVKITGIAAAHNEGDPFVQKDGTDYLFVVEVAGMRIAHLGDLGQDQLTAEQLKALGSVDVLFSQITNSFSDATLANRKGIRLVGQIKPRVFIPTHVIDDTAAAVQDAAKTWPATYSTKKSVVFTPATLPAATQLLFLGSDAETFAKLTNAKPLNP